MSAGTSAGTFADDVHRRAVHRVTAAIDPTSGEVL